LDGLDRWATSNERDARNDAIRFWIFKIVAILSSSGSGVLTYLGWKFVNIVLAAAATVCVSLDGLYPGGTLRNAHLGAVHDLRDLEQNSLTEWRKGIANGEDQRKLEARILGDIETERKKIEANLRQAETQLGTTQNK
jgi:hypothetical protein